MASGLDKCARCGATDLHIDLVRHCSTCYANLRAENERLKDVVLSLCEWASGYDGRLHNVALGMVVMKARAVLSDSFEDSFDDDTPGGSLAKIKHLVRLMSKEPNPEIRDYATELAELIPGLAVGRVTEIHGGKPCCHPPCSGTWGANCPHCHWLDHVCPDA